MHIDNHALKAVLENRLQLRVNAERVMMASKANPFQHANDTHELSWAHPTVLSKNLLSHLLSERCF